MSRDPQQRPKQTEPLLKIIVEIWQLFSRKGAILVAETCSCAVIPSVGRRAMCPLSLLCARKHPQNRYKTPQNATRDQQLN